MFTHGCTNAGAPIKISGTFFIGILIFVAILLAGVSYRLRLLRRVKKECENPFSPDFRSRRHKIRFPISRTPHHQKTRMREAARVAKYNWKYQRGWHFIPPSPATARQEGVRKSFFARSSEPSPKNTISQAPPGVMKIYGK